MADRQDDDPESQPPAPYFGQRRNVRLRDVIPGRCPPSAGSPRQQPVPPKTAFNHLFDERLE